MTMRRLAVTLAVALCAAGSARAADPADADALSLADQAPVVPQRAHDWQLSAEAARVHSVLRGAASPVEAARLSFDLRYDGTPAAGLRAVLSDRLDLTHSNTSPRESNVNTLREAYLSWQKSADEIVDVGRVNLRYGAGSGYNPTDFFKAGALRSIVSPAPASLRENRLGTVVLQGQKLWSATSLTAAYSPRLGSTPSTDTFSLDFGATNPRHRWLIAASHKFSDAFNPQLLLYGGAGMSPQAGLNLSGLVNDATIAYLEVSAGKGRALVAQALAQAEAEHWQRRAALGLTTTTAFNLSLTAEAELNSAAPDRVQWDALRAGAPSNPLRLLGAAQTLQDLPVRQALFFYATWQDLLVKHVDLSAFVRSDLVTHSRTQWLEARYHWDRVDAALQWQLYSGGPGSVYATVPQQRSVQLVLRVFL
jgi:opacity protein-like surface antigen